MSTAFFTSSIVVDFDPAEESAEEALSSYAADNDVMTSYELMRVEHSGAGDGDVD
jgi:hypothetical protein